MHLSYWCYGNLAHITDILVQLPYVPENDDDDDDILCDLSSMHICNFLSVQDRSLRQRLPSSYVLGSHVSPFHAYKG
jgi:hypothetical protein